MIEKACVQIGAIDPSCDEYNSGSVIGVNADQAVVTDQIVSGRPKEASTAALLTRWDKCGPRSPQRPQDFLRYLANGL